jgi:hypothetical protein
MERTHLKFSVKDGVVTVMSEINPGEGVYETRTTCRVCEGASLVPVLDMGEQYLPRFVTEIDFSLPRAPLELVQCERCNLLQLRHTVNRELLFREYWYRSSMNQSMRDALSNLVDHALQYHHSGAWLDIGANDGWLISRIPPGFHTTACEPAADFAVKLAETADLLVPDFFTHEMCPGPYDVITSAAMFYDLDNPNQFVHDIAKSLSPDGVWINQLNDSPTMLRATAFDGICHEHLTYYDMPVLENLYRQHGLTITRVTSNEVNGGSIRVVARKSTRQREDLLGHPMTLPIDAQAFARRSLKWRERMLELCEGTFSRGATWCYGASTKGTALLQFLGDTSSFLGVADRNPLKHGLRMVGSWLPIVSEEVMRAADPKYVLVLPWAFRDEFAQREKSLLEAGGTMVFPLPNIEMVL